MSDSEVEEVKSNSSDRLRRVHPLSHATSNDTLVTDKLLVVVSISSGSVVPNGGTNPCDSNTRVSSLLHELALSNKSAEFGDCESVAKEKVSAREDVMDSVDWDERSYSGIEVCQLCLVCRNQFRYSGDVVRSNVLPKIRSVTASYIQVSIRNLFSLNFRPL